MNRIQFFLTSVIVFVTITQGFSQSYSSSFLSTNTLTAEVADLDGDGDMDIVGGGLRSLYWEENMGNNLFLNHVISQYQPEVQGIAPIDLDGDGYMDIVSASTSNNAIYWSRNNGVQYFTTVISITGAGGPVAVDGGDLDGDGDMDLVYAAFTGDRITYLKNDGTQTFTSINLITGFDSAIKVKVADLDNDGDSDIVAAAREGGKIVWFRNEGSDNFTTITVIDPLSMVRDIELKDFDGDGLKDILYCSNAGYGWFENTGGAFTQHALSAYIYVRAVDCADIDGDGDMDLVYTEVNNNNVYCNFYDANQNLTGGGLMDSGIGSPDVVGVADFDNNGFYDVVGAGDLDVRVTFAYGGTNFTNLPLTKSVSNLNGACHGDFDNDGDIDLACVGFLNLLWYRNEGNGEYTPIRILDQINNAWVTTADGVYMRSADVDGDGDTDILFSENDNNRVSWLVNHGGGTFEKRTMFTLPDAYSIDPIDFDLDGDMDVIATKIVNDAVYWYENDGNETFTQHLISGSYWSPLEALGVDYDNDGDIDVISAQDDPSNKLVLYRNSGNDLTFTTVVIDNAAPGCNSTYFIDLDQDGDMDFLSATSTDDRIQWYRNDNFTFTKITIGSGIGFATYVYSDDYDGDGDYDVICSSLDDKTMDIFFNDGNENFTKVNLASYVEGAHFIESGNLDDDPELEIYGVGRTHGVLEIFNATEFITPPPIEIADCSELFISEYVEGTSFNKAIEIYNPTAFPVNLANYTIQTYTNGASAPTGTAFLSGTIDPYGVKVVAHQSADPEFNFFVDAIEYGFTFNGNDAIALTKNGTLIDIIGVIGQDPGTAWTGGGASTLDMTLVRKPGITHGNNVNGPTFDPSLEWIAYPNNAWQYIGWHESACEGGCIPSIAITASQNNICGNQSITFTATVTDEGTAPVYQWYKNNTPVGTNSNTYTDATWSNGDVVFCVLTSNAECAFASNFNSNTIVISVNTPATVSVNISTPTTTICAGTTAVCTATPTNGGSTPAYQWMLNGNNVGTNSPTYNASGLSDGDIVVCTITSNASCVASSSATSNSIVFDIVPSVTPAVSITTSTNNVCANTSITFTASPTNGGTSPSYQWKKNGFNVGANSNTYTASSWLNGDVITCVMTSNADCLSTSSATSNSITVTASANVTPSVSISASQTTGCASTAITFTANPVNGGSTPSYQWKKNGFNVGTNSNVYSAASWANGDVITCVMTSNATCVTSTTANSNSITLSISPAVTPSIFLQSSDNSICAGELVVFTGFPTNGGSSPSYVWTINGEVVSTNGNGYNSASLVNGDQVQVTMTSNVACATTTNASSNIITMSVTPTVMPTISISASQTSICAGTSVTFSAAITNAGTSPIYQWKKNGFNLGANSATYVGSGLVTGDVITCVLTSNATCASPATITSNSITMSVTANVTPAITIAASQTTVCGAEQIVFSATPTNGGSSPSYQWKRNGFNVGSNSSAYIASDWTNGDVVTCVLTSNAACVTGSVTSNAITVNVQTPVDPTVSIATSTSTVCDGEPIAIIATPTNGGSAPTYIWRVNNQIVGGSGASYTSSTWQEGDIVDCTLVSNASCVTSSVAQSNSLLISVTDIVVPTISIDVNDNAVCPGTSLMFTATASDTGNNPIYTWMKNGFEIGTNNATLATSDFENGDVITCQLESSATCASPASMMSNSITMQVIPVTIPTITIQASTTEICEQQNIEFNASVENTSDPVNYQWYVNDVMVGENAATFNQSTWQNGDEVSCIISVESACTIDPVASESLQISVTEIATPIITVEGNTLTVDFIPGAVYTWYNAAGEIIGANSNSYEPSEDGTYSVMVELDGCFSEMSDEVVFTFTTVVSMDESAIIVFPNPANQHVRIVGGSNVNAVEIFNSVGQRIYAGNERVLSTTQWAAGVYTVIVKTTKTNAAFRLVIAH